MSLEKHRRGGLFFTFGEETVAEWVFGQCKNLWESEGESAILPRMSLLSSPTRVRARISTRIFLRLTAMDVCCGPPARQ
jgi:hypothetical protein